MWSIYNLLDSLGSDNCIFFGWHHNYQYFWYKLGQTRICLTPPEVIIVFLTEGVLIYSQRAFKILKRVFTITKLIKLLKNWYLLLFVSPKSDASQACPAVVGSLLGLSLTLLNCFRLANNELSLAQSDLNLLSLDLNNRQNMHPYLQNKSVLWFLRFFQGKSYKYIFTNFDAIATMVVHLIHWHQMIRSNPLASLSTLGQQ